MPLLLTRMLSLMALMAGGMVLMALVLPSFAGAGLGMVSGALLWLAWDNWRAQGFIDWLHRLWDAQDAPPPGSGGLYREAVERLQRLLRKHARETLALEDRLRNLQSALQASPNGIIILDEHECIEWCNRTACEHFGLDAHRDLSQKVTHLLRAPTLIESLAARNFSEVLLLDSPLSTAAHPLRLEMHFLPYEAGHLLLLSRDITSIEQAEAMRRDFVANVSHEIRTPLTVLIGFIETLQTLPLERDAQMDMLSRMNHQAQRMKNLVGDLLTLFRLEGSPVIRQWTPVRALLEQLNTDATAFSAHGAQSPRHTLIFEGMETADEILGAGAELQSAMLNLINNAICYTPSGGKIVVSWQVRAEGACFAVQDNGPGIAPEHIPRLTERFYRVNPDRSTGGTGLGLSIVKHVLQRHDGTLNIASSPEGSCFTMNFPPGRIKSNVPSSE